MSYGFKNLSTDLYTDDCEISISYLHGMSYGFSCWGYACYQKRGKKGLGMVKEQRHV